jgi:two-component system, NtrC family, sensor kinase
VRARHMALVMLVAVGMAPIIIAGLLMVRRAEHTALDQVSESNSRIAERAAKRLTAYVAEQEHLLETLGDALNPIARLTPQQAQRIVRGYGITFPQMRSLAVVGMDCIEVATTRFDNELHRRCGEKPVDEALAGRKYRSQISLQKGLVPTMTFGVPLDLVGERIGVVVADLDMVAIWDVVNEIKVGATGRARLISSDGTLIAHGDPEQVGRVFLEQKDPTFSSVRAYPPGHGIRMRDTRRRDVLAVRADVPEVGWTLVIEQPVEEAFAPARAMRRDLFIVIAVALALVVVVGLAVGSGPVRSLESMRAHAVRIGRGELEARVELPKLHELRALAESLNQMAVELSQLQNEMRARERLNTFAGVAAGLAHDLQLPIENARDAVSYALDHPERSDAPHVLKRALEADLAKLSRFVRDLRRLAREGAVPLVMHAVDPDVVAQRVVNDASASPRWHGVKFGWTGHAAPVWADEDLVARAVGNLVSNAADASVGRSGASVTIEVSDDPDTKFVNFSVRDTGPGIPPQRLSEILVGDFKSDKRHSGVGLGLGVARHVAAAHGGALTAESVVGEGSVFRLRLARKQMTDGPVESSAARQARGGGDERGVERQGAA